MGDPGDVEAVGLVGEICPPPSGPATPPCWLLLRPRVSKGVLEAMAAAEGMYKLFFLVARFKEEFLRRDGFRNFRKRVDFRAENK